MPRYHESKFRPTVKERSDGRWYILLELHDGTGIPDVDSGRREVGLLLPADATDEDALALAHTLKDMADALLFIE